MRVRLIFPVLLFASLLTVALSTGSRLFFLLALLVLLTVLAGLFSVVWATATFSVSAELADRTVRRGDDTMLLFTVRHRGLLPIAPVMLEVVPPSGTAREIRLKDMPGRTQTLRMPIHASHVGVFQVGIRSAAVEDLLGIYRRRFSGSATPFEMAILPRTFDTDPLEMAPGDPGTELMARATEDLNAPSDIRSYQPGDAMKKIHWKLSLRKGELMVRKYDEPVLQEVLAVMDCSRPPAWGHPQAEADVRDALLETAASVFESQCRTDHVIRLPLLGSHPTDLDKRMGINLAFEDLARVDFSETDRFERVLMMESRRLRKVGCVVVISARLTSAMVEIMIRMRRVGPNLRFYLVTFAPDDTNLLPLISRLRQAAIEVSCVTPDTQSA